MKFILGRKIEMSQRYATDGHAITVTKVVAGPCVVTQLKTDARDGYTAVQVGFGARRRVSKPVAGHLKGRGPFQVLHEFRVTPAEAERLALGDQLTVTSFSAGDVVKVTGTTKGRGFQGVVKRWGFKGQPQTHGHKDQFRHPGSSGPGGWQHVRPGKRFPGRMGADQVSVKNLEVIAVEPDKNALYVQGSIPGSRNGLLMIQCEGELKVEKVSTDAPAAVAKPVAATPPVQKVEAAK